MRIVVSGRAQKIADYLEHLRRVCTIVSCDVPEAVNFNKSAIVTAVCQCDGNHFPLQEMSLREYCGLTVTVQIKDGDFCKSARKVNYVFKRRVKEYSESTQYQCVLCQDSEQETDMKDDMSSFELTEDWEDRVRELGIMT